MYLGIATHIGIYWNETWNGSMNMELEYVNPRARSYIYIARYSEFEW